jgi:hypothetical protein
MSRFLRPELLFLVSFLAAACGGNDDPLPTEPSPATFTEVFAGTLNPNGAATHPFGVSRSGLLTAQLTAVSHESTGADPSLVMGLSLGTWNGSACQITLAKDDAVQNTVLTGQASQAGALCVRVYDVGRFTENTTYEVQVVHF